MRASVAHDQAAAAEDINDWSRTLLISAGKSHLSRYHKTHGHSNQQLRENDDGTFSIVNPETAAPYEGFQGMEKEKPFRCEVCGKRYKNLNGLKYVWTHAHSYPCTSMFPAIR